MESLFEGGRPGGRGARSGARRAGPAFEFGATGAGDRDGEGEEERTHRKTLTYAGRPPARLDSAGSAEDERSRAAAFRQPFFGFAFDAYRGVHAHDGETRTGHERSRVGLRKIFWR